MNKVLSCIGMWAALFLCPSVSAQDSAQIEAGEMIYNEHCASCHGDKLRDPGSAPDLRDLGSNDRERFDRMVLDGKGQMPSMQGMLSTQELDQLWSYIRSRARG
jgi:mono/diheme cytochrome c family protein